MNRDELILAAVQGLLAAPDCDLDKVADKAIAVADQVLAKTIGGTLTGVWVDHDGKDWPPIPVETKVHIKTKNGHDSLDDKPSSVAFWGQAPNWWIHGRGPSEEIAAYMVVA